MNSSGRTTMIVVACLALAALFAWGFRDLPPAGDYRGPYGYVVSQVAVYERHATDVVNAITYDYRGFDTLGEEFILFSSVLGVLLLFRPSGGNKEGSESQEQLHRDDKMPVSDTLRTTMQAMVGVMVVFGVYVGTHGQLTPGGGFQGGVILATAPLVVYLSGGLEIFHGIVSSWLIKLCESGGAAGYALIGIAALLFGANFLTNIVPLGTTGDLFSSGTIALISVSVALEVTGGFVVLMKAFLEEVLESVASEEGK